MIGTEDNARTITAIAWSTRENEDGWIALDSYGDIPEGWEYIGSGAYRHCFRGPDGYVYKVPTQDGLDVARYGADTEGTNTNSFYRYQTFAPVMPEGVRLAACTFLPSHNVLVQEYVEGTVPDVNEAWYALLDTLRKAVKVTGVWMDLHDMNVILTPEGPVVIDW